MFRVAVLASLLLLSSPASSAEESAVSAAGPAPSAGAEAPAGAIDNPMSFPDLSSVIKPATDRKGMSVSLQILVLMTVLSLAPALMIMMTCFTRIVIVLAMLRQGMGTQQLPPNQVLVTLALFMTFLVMAPTWQRVYHDAIHPYLENELTQEEALETGAAPIREFMISQIEQCENEAEVYLFLEHTEAADATTWKEVPTTALVPAFMLSELKTAFIMGFRIYLPFLVIDMVIASILISMGMMMLPPVLISLPFKILLFVLVDGWYLVVGSLLHSFA